jgi:hypothetical protein
MNTQLFAVVGIAIALVLVGTVGISIVSQHADALIRLKHPRGCESDSPGAGPSGDRCVEGNHGPG